MAKYIRGGLGKTSKRGRRKSLRVQSRGRKEVVADLEASMAKGYEGDYQQGGGSSYGARLARGFAMLRDE